MLEHKEKLGYVSIYVQQLDGVVMHVFVVVGLPWLNAWDPYFDIGDILITCSACIVNPGVCTLRVYQRPPINLISTGSFHSRT